MEKSFILTETQLGKIFATQSEFPWKQANPVMEILRNAKFVEEKESKKEVPKQSQSSSSTKKS